MPPAKPPAVTYRYEGDIPHPIDAAFAWLTDYTDADHTLTTAVVKERRVVQRKGDEIVLEGAIENLGQRWTGRGVVTLHPAQHRWVAVLKEGKMVNEYRLTPTPSGCRLSVRYDVYSKRWTRRLVLRLARRRVEREIAAMWRGFFEAMARDNAAAPSVTSTRP